MIITTRKCTHAVSPFTGGYNLGFGGYNLGCGGYNLDCHLGYNHRNQKSFGSGALATGWPGPCCLSGSSRLVLPACLPA